MIAIQSIQNRIYEIRGERVMLDMDLAALYAVEVRVLNQSVKRNIKRFPEDFMFQLTATEWKNMSSQNVTTYTETSPSSQIVMMICYSLMKKIILFLLLFSILKVSAQESQNLKTVFSAGLELGIPQASVYTIGLGASGKLELPVSNKLCITVTAGYDAFFYKGNLYESSRTPSAAIFVPLKAGAKYYFNQGVYAEGELGTAIETNYLKQDLFAFSLGPGFIIPLNEAHGIDFGLRYENWSNHQVKQTALRFAYRF